MAEDIGRRVRLTAMESAVETQLIVAAALEDVVQSGGDMLYDHYLKEREVSYAVERSLQDMHHVLNWAYLARSEAAGLDEDITADTGAGRWGQEAEPEPCKTDSWARGAVPLKKKPKPAYTAGAGSGEGSSSAADGRAASAAGSTASRRTRPGMRAGSSGGRSVSGGKSPRSDTSGAAGVVVERPSSAGLSAAGGSVAGSSRPSSPTAVVRAQALATMKAQQEAAARKKERQAEEKQREAAQATRLAKELRGKDFTYDADGNVIIVNSVNSGKLPPQYHSVGIAISLDAPAPTEEPKRRRRRRASVQSQASAAAHKRTGALQKGTEEEMFEESGKVQPPLAESMLVSPGVLLREGENTKHGPEPREDPLHMSRREFHLHQTTLLESQPQSVPMNGTGVPALGGMPSPSREDSKAEASAAAPPQASPQASPPGTAAYEAVPEQSDDEGAGLGSPAAGTRRQDVNLELTSAQDWGVNDTLSPAKPAVLPHKPGSREGSTIFVRADTKHPRDRPFITTKPRRKRPAPYPGITRFGDAGATGGLGEGSLTSRTRGSQSLSVHEGDSHSVTGSPSPSRRKPGQTWGRPTRQDSARDLTARLNVTPAAKELLGLGK